MRDVNANQIIHSNFLLHHNTKYKAIQEEYFTAQNVSCSCAGHDSI